MAPPPTRNCGKLQPDTPVPACTFPHMRVDREETAVDFAQGYAR